MLTSEQQEQQAQLKKAVLNSNNVVFFGGAGVSTESGIPDFRSADGLWNQSYRYPPEQVVSRSFFEENPEAFYEFYRDKMLFTDAQPNAAHLKLAELESAGHLSAVITQNVDGLHQAAGSQTVIELHGSSLRNYCLGCGARYGIETIVESKGVPRCTECGGIIRPDVVLYEEPLDNISVQGAIAAIAKADVLIVAGTSLAVYPAAGFLDYFRGETLAVINLAPGPLDKQADIQIAAKVGEVLSWD